MSILKIHSLVTLSAIFTLGLATLTGCEVEDQDGLDSGLDTAAVDEGDDLAANDEDDSTAIPWSGATWVCEGSGTITLSPATVGKDTTWGSIYWSGYTETYGGVTTGTITINPASMKGSSSGTAPDTTALAGTVKFNGSSCGSTISVIKHSVSSATGSTSCTASWDGSLKQITVMDGTSNARWEFIRGTTNNKINRAFSGYAHLSPLRDCWWE